MIRGRGGKGGASGEDERGEEGKEGRSVLRRELHAVRVSWSG